jgi:CRISPR-associated protein Csb2
MDTTVLSFGVEFLGPVILSNPYRPSEPEWPPAPARIYSALIAAACDHQLGGEVIGALQTMEGTAPSITMPSASSLPTHQVAVPTAHTFRGLALMPEPELYPESPVVSYHWSVPTASAGLIGQAIRCLSHVGRAESLVIGDVHSGHESPTPNLVPDEAGSLMLRVPMKGRYEVLERDFQRGRHTLQLDPAQRYRATDKVRVATPSSNPWGNLIALRIKPCDIRSTAHVAQGLRAAVLSVVGDDAHPQIHGHGCPDHVAWLALPNVGSEHSAGTVIGVAALVPATISPEAEQQLRRAMATLEEIPFRNAHRAVSLPTKPMATLQHATWSRASHLWATATPVVLEHKVGPNASRAIAQAIVRSGYPRPLRVISDVIPSLTGAVHASEYSPRRYSTLPRRHAIVEFAEPIQGPLLAGGERYFGLGLFKPISGART